MAGRASDDPRRPPGQAGWSALWSVGLALRRFMLRTGQGPLRPVWHIVYEAFLHAVAFLLRRDLDVSVYVKGTIGTGEPIYGVSDVDLVVIASTEPDQPGHGRSRIRERWDDLCRRLPPLAWVVSELYPYEDDELRDVATATCFTYGLDRPEPRPAAFYGRRHEDAAGLLRWPGLWPTMEWRLLAGPERRPANVPDDPAHRRLVSWLMLQSWWRYAFDAVLRPDDPHVAYLCVKLVAEPARMLLWLTGGHRVLRRREVLQRAGEIIPEERSAFERALDLLDSLHHSPPAPVDEFLPIFLRLSTRVAATIAMDAEPAGATVVRLIGADDEPLLGPAALEGFHTLDSVAHRPRLRSLVDWRTLAAPRPGDEAFFHMLGDPSHAAELRAATKAFRVGVYPTLRTSELLVLACDRPGHRVLRSVQCPLSDPVSFALMDGRPEATFPGVPGWSALEGAQRAVAEHRAWLDEHRRFLVDGRSNHQQVLAMLLSAGRAARLLESVQGGAAELTVTLSATATMLAQQLPHAATAVEEGFGAYRAAVLDDRPVESATVVALLAAVDGLAPYRVQR